MANKKINKQETINTSIIEVVVNGMTAIEIVEDIKTRIASIEKSVFNIALECAFALGHRIPEYIDIQGNTHGEAICAEPFKKQADLIDKVGRSKQTISRWIEAMTFILENDYFQLFANGSLPFSYDKIITICKNDEVFAGYVFSDLMAFTVKQLEDLVAKKTKKTTEEQEEQEQSSDKTEEQESTEQAEEKTEVETTVISYNGSEYTVPKQAFEKWLSENATVNVTK